MKGIKVYLLVVSGLLLLALCCSVYVWFKLQALEVTHSDEAVTSEFDPEM